MNREVEAMLAKSPSPVSYAVAFFLLLLGGILVHAAFFYVAMSLVGYYFGNYHGRFSVMRAWQRDLQIQSTESRERPESTVIG